MATAKQHNDLIKVVFDGNKHMGHVLTDDRIRQMTMIEGRWPLTKLPVCGHCEKLGLWSTDVLTKKLIGVCRSCGTITKNPVTYSSYLACQQDIDSTGKTFRNMAMLDKKRDYINRNIFLPEYSRL